MSLNTIVSQDLASRLADLTVADLRTIVKVASLGYNAEAIHAGLGGVARGEEPELPKGVGAPRPLKIMAWSFVKDRGQYHDTYRLTSAKAGELADLLLRDVDAGREEIRSIVAGALSARGSNKPVEVDVTGVPGATSAQTGAPVLGRSAVAALKAEIRTNSGIYGSYRFDAEPTGRVGPSAFRVRLGGGLYATFQSKEGAVAVARICRVKGRRYPLVVDHVALWLEGKTPLYGDDIPSKVEFTGAASPSAPLLADPAGRTKTEAPA
jgi:hypothetical protein